MLYNEYLFTHTYSNGSLALQTWRDLLVPIYNGKPVRKLYTSTGDLIYDGLLIENAAVNYFVNTHVILDASYYHYPVLTYNYTYEDALALQNASTGIYSDGFKSSVLYSLWRLGNFNFSGNINVWDTKYNNNRKTDEYASWTVRPMPIVVDATGGVKVRVSTDIQFTTYYDFTAGNNVEVENPNDSTNDMLQNVGNYCTCLYNLIPGVKYYYRVLDSEDNVVKSGTFIPKGLVRMIALDNVNNVRDIGGWPCDGGYLAYGKLYRGCGLSTSNDLNKGRTGYPSDKAKSILVNQLNIKKVIDLRVRSGTLTISLPSGVTIVNAPMDDDYIYGSEINNNNNRTAIKNVLNSIVTSLDNNEAVYICCNHGLDRTGTIACLIELICGCDFEAVIKDYELSCFHASDLLNATSIYHSSKLWATILYLQGQSGDTLNEKCVNWLKSIGVTQTTLDKIRNNMITPKPAIDTRIQDEPCIIQNIIWL